MARSRSCPVVATFAYAGRVVLAVTRRPGAVREGVDRVGEPASPGGKVAAAVWLAARRGLADWDRVYDELWAAQEIPPCLVNRIRSIG